MNDCCKISVYYAQASYIFTLFTTPICLQIFGMAEKEMEYRVELFNKYVFGFYLVGLFRIKHKIMLHNQCK